jgi:hypothetical protein
VFWECADVLCYNDKRKVEKQNRITREIFGELSIKLKMIGKKI